MWKERRDKESTIHWFIPHVSTVMEAGQGWSQEPGTQSECPTWVEETQVLNLVCIASQAEHCRKLGLEGDPGDEPTVLYATEAPHMVC